MKKIVLLNMLLLFFVFAGTAQVSYKGTKEPNELPEELSERLKRINAIAKRTADSLITTLNTSGTKLSKKQQKDKAKDIIKAIEDTIDNIVSRFHSKRMDVFLADSIKDKDPVITQLTKKRDILINYQKDIKWLVKYWKNYDRFEEVNQSKNFFPAYFSTQAVKFFEDDSVHVKLFQNNLINYSPRSKKMTLYTEAVNDYLGPIRVGIGFQIESEAKVDSLQTVDSTQKLEKKADMLAAIQNGGGDIAINAKYPVIKSGNDNAVLQYKFYLYANAGFSLPVLNKASDDFLLNYNGGLEGSLYSKGFNNRLTFFAQLRLGYYSGNMNFRKIITDANEADPTNFLMFESSFGLDFLDGYRLSVDLFSGSSFVRKNFPATVTFIVRPGKSDGKK